MISAIIDTLNAKLSLLTYFEKRYCLTELKTETKGETEITSPVHYVGSESWEKIQIDKYRGVSYWRKDGDVSVERVDDLGNAKDFVNVTFPLRLVGYVNRKDTAIDDEYSPDRVANALVKQLNFKNGELKQTLKAKRVISTVTDYSTNSAEIWEEETSGTGKVDVPFKFAVVSVSVEIEVLARIDCLETECEQDSDILHAFDFCLPSVIDRLTPTQVACLNATVCLDDELRQDWQVHPSISDAYYSYIGVAPNGSEESAEVWKITRITVFQDGTSTDPSPTAEDVAWTDRLTLTYT